MQSVAYGLLALLPFLFLFVHVCHGFNVAARESEAYADQSIHAIITTWSEDELIKRASPELKADTNQGELDSAFANMRKLGKLQSYSGLDDNGKVRLNWTNGHFSYIAYYEAKATFQNGRLLVTIHIVKRDKQWQITGFHVDPEPFL